MRHAQAGLLARSPQLASDLSAPVLLQTMAQSSASDEFSGWATDRSRTPQRLPRHDALSDGRQADSGLQTNPSRESASLERRWSVFWEIDDRMVLRFQTAPHHDASWRSLVRCADFGQHQ